MARPPAPDALQVRRSRQLIGRRAWVAGVAGAVPLPGAGLGG